MFLLDNSAWAHLDKLNENQAAEIADLFETRQIYTCLPFLLEVGYSSRSAKTHREILDELKALPTVHITAKTEHRALAAQSQLADLGHHKLPPVDLLIAAVADTHNLAILHYDNDYDIIAQKTNLTFTSQWLAPKGTL